MTRHSFRFLGGDNSSVTTTESPELAVDSDFVVILAALLCALICVLGLLAVARCAWLRRIPPDGNTSRPSATQTQANKGLKKKVIRSLPKLTFTVDSSVRFSDCAICLAEFTIGDEIRVLPQCGHAFHVRCVDTWLGSHSSCPSCRQILVASRCQKCGEFPSSSSAGEVDSEVRLKEREDNVNR